MDIIIDTNILRHDHFLRSPKSKALFDYLEKTRSHLIIPTIVKQEMIAIFRRTLIDLDEQIRNKAKKIDEWCYDVTPKTEFYLDIDKEMSTYESFIRNLTYGGGALELPYEERFLAETVHRLVERVKPATAKGSEFRDIIMWLSIKKFLKESKREAAFISQDIDQFADKESKELHPDLAAELEKDKLKLKYFNSVDDFIRQHSSKIDYINAEWISRALHQKSLENMVKVHIQGNTEFWQEFVHINGLVFVREIAVDFALVDIEDFYVYEIESGDLFLHASCLGTILVELQIERTNEYRSIFEEIDVDVEGTIHQEKLEDLTIEWWAFTDEKLEKQFGYIRARSLSSSST